ASSSSSSASPSRFSSSVVRSPPSIRRTACRSSASWITSTKVTTSVSTPFLRLFSSTVMAMRALLAVPGGGERPQPARRLPGRQDDALARRVHDQPVQPGRRGGPALDPHVPDAPGVQDDGGADIGRRLPGQPAAVQPRPPAAPQGAVPARLVVPHVPLDLGGVVLGGEGPGPQGPDVRGDPAQALVE